jgi:hypothetical protein
VVLVTVAVVVVPVDVVMVTDVVVSVPDVDVSVTEVVDTVLEVNVQSLKSPNMNSCTALSSSLAPPHVPSLFKNPSIVHPMLLVEVPGYACFCSTVLSVSSPLEQLA